MSKPKHVQLSIPHPCTQNWDKMTPEAKGRHCAHCQKTVIDFTSWSDTALYNYFTKNTGAVCGRFTAMQLDRPMSIPYQPHSKLYRIAVALGLTLTLSPALHTYAQNRPPWLPAQCSVPVHKPVTDCPPSPIPGELRGNIVDDKKEPLPTTVVEMFRNGVLIAGNVSDYDGNYSIKALEPGTYEVKFLYLGMDSVTTTGVVITDSAVTKLDCTMQPSRNYKCSTGAVYYTGYSRIIDMDNPTKRTFSRESIDRMPH